MTELNATAHKVLDVAERLTQTRGFNAFSYKDLQNEVGIKTATIHYYFPTKQDLALRMTERYVEGTRELLNSLSNQNKTSIELLNELGGLFVNLVEEDKFCVCGMLASDMLSLPDDVNSKLQEFFNLVEGWIAQVMDTGLTKGEIKTGTNPQAAAALLLAAIEGGMLVARIHKRASHLRTIIQEFLQQYEV